MKDRIREIRDSLGLTLIQFAESIGVTYQTISLWENGAQSVGTAYILLICKTHNVNQHWLETGDGKPFTAPANPIDALSEISLLVELSRRSIDKLDVKTKETLTDFVTQLAAKLAKPDGKQEA